MQHPFYMGWQHSQSPPHDMEARVHASRQEGRKDTPQVSRTYTFKLDLS